MTDAMRTNPLHDTSVVAEVLGKGPHGVRRPVVDGAGFPGAECFVMRQDDDVGVL